MPQEVFFSNIDFQVILLALVFIFFAIIAVISIRIVFSIVYKEQRYKSLDFVHLMVTVPKESARARKAKEEEEHREVQEDIAVAEVFFSSIGGLRAEHGLKAWFFGRSDHLSFEIVSDHNVISFYVVAPRKMAQYIEQQIHSQFQEAHIEEVTDYNIFAPVGVVRTVSLQLSQKSIFPLKTYKQMESDPLNALTNALSRIREPEGAAIQFIVRSAKPGWRRRGIHIASKMQQGMDLKGAMRATSLIGRFFPIARRGKNKGKPGEAVRQEPYRLSPKEEEVVKGIEEKASKAGMDVNIRIVVSASDQTRAQAFLENIANAFTQYNIYQYGNKFSFSKPQGRANTRLAEEFIYRAFNRKDSFVLNTEELAGMFHFPLPGLETPNIRWLVAKKLAPPSNIPTEGMVLGTNIYRGVETIVRIKNEDRRRHLYMIGMTGVGKSNLMANMAIQDIQAGKGVCVIDPHGSLIEDILPHIPRSRIEDVVYFDPSDVERPIGLNMLEAKTPEARDFAVQEMIAIFYKLVTDPSMIGPIFEHNMRNAMLTLMFDEEHPGTIVDIPRIFTDTDFQKYKLKFVKDPLVRAFWEKEMAKTSDYHKSETLGYLISKVGRFVENEMVRNIIGQPNSGFSLRKIMDEQKILLVNLSKGKTGEMNANLLGLILVSKLQMAALARADMPEKDRKDFFLYIDEFQNFVTDSVATILAEARKYRLDLIIGHQYLGQLEKGAGVEGKREGTLIRDAIFGNIGTMICFRIGPEDAETMAKQFAPRVNEYDLINVERYHAYIRLLIDNTAAKPFHFTPFSPKPGDPQVAIALKSLSRLKYGRDRAIVENEILERTKLGEILEKTGIKDAEASR